MSGGLALAGAGMALMGGLDVHSEWTALLAGFIVAGIGVGLLNPVIADVALSVVPKEQSGMAAGINDTFRQVGVAVGIAAWGAVFLGTGASKAQDVAGGPLPRPGARPGRSDLLGGAAAGARRRPRRGARARRATPPNRGSSTASTRCCCSARSSPSPAPRWRCWLVREGEIERETLVGTELEREPPSPRRPEPTRRTSSRYAGGSAFSPGVRRWRRLPPMRLVTYDAGDGARAGVIEDDRVADAWALLGEPHRGGLRELLAAGRVDDLRARLGDAGAPSHPLAAVRLLPPIPDPDKIVCIGLNYREHAAEVGMEPPEHPIDLRQVPQRAGGARARP